MNENILEVHELDELRTAYKQMDERLDGQEIVSDEKLREAMYSKFADIRRNAKEGLVWLNLILVPMFLWKDWYDNSLTLFGIIVMAVYWVASLLFRFFILRKTRKEDYGTYDLKTLTDKESRYQKNIKWSTIIFVLFWAVYCLQWMLVKGSTASFIFLVLMLTLLIPMCIRYLIIKFKYKGESIDPATGKPRVLKVKWLSVVLYSIVGILISLVMIGFVYNLTLSKSFHDVLGTMNILPPIIALASVILTALRQKKRLTVSRKLIFSLMIIAVVMAVGIFAIAYFMNFSNLCNPTILFSVACISFLAYLSNKSK